MNEYLQRTINIIVKGTVGAIPVLGPTISEVCGTVLPDPVICNIQEELMKNHADIKDLQLKVHRILSTPIISHYLELEELDYYLLQRICDKEIEMECRPLVAGELIRSIEDEGYSLEDIGDSLEVLENRGYIKRILGNNSLLHIHALTSEEYGFDTYCENEIENWDEIKVSIAKAIMFDDKNSTVSIIDHLSLPRMIVYHILEEFSYQGFIDLSEPYCDGRYKSKTIYGTTAELKRWLKSQTVEQ